jgi:spore cortex biosynthesis protein YabQ
MIPVEAQVKALIVMILFGFAMGVGFEIYRELKRIFRLRPRAINFWDLVIWLIFLGVAYGVLLHINYGQVRLFVFIAMALGLLIYFRFFSPIARRPISILLIFVLKVLSLVWKVVRIPLVLVHRVLMLPGNLISLLILKIISSFKKLKTNLKTKVKTKLNNKNTK